MCNDRACDVVQDSVQCALGIRPPHRTAVAVYLWMKQSTMPSCVLLESKIGALHKKQRDRYEIRSIRRRGMAQRPVEPFRRRFFAVERRGGRRTPRAQRRRGCTRWLT